MRPQRRIPRSSRSRTAVSDWLDKVANPLKAEGVSTIRITKVYEDGVQESVDYPIEDYLVVDTNYRNRRNLSITHRAQVRAINEALQASIRAESEWRREQMNYPG
jgi:hypothetical protein